jgi:DNA-binding NtrC family response regulator
LLLSGGKHSEVLVVDPSRYRVLLVDDDFGSRSILARLLKRHFEVDTASCYDEALAAADAAVPHVVVTDISLRDGHDGIKLMAALRERHGIRGIAVSGYRQEDAKALHNAGLVHCFLKPLRFEKLLAAIQELCPNGRSASSNGD